jgi:hypothetical protein
VTMPRPDAEGERASRDRGAAFERFSRAVDGPMMILALAMIPLIVVPLIMDLSPGMDHALVAIDYLIWAAFTIEYVVKLCLAPDRWRFVKANIPDLIIVVVPMLRPCGYCGARGCCGCCAWPGWSPSPSRACMRSATFYAAAG